MKNLDKDYKKKNKNKLLNKRRNRDESLNEKTDNLGVDIDMNKNNCLGNEKSKKSDKRKISGAKRKKSKEEVEIGFKINNENNDNNDNNDRDGKKFNKSNKIIQTSKVNKANKSNNSNKIKLFDLCRDESNLNSKNDSNNNASETNNDFEDDSESLKNGENPNPIIKAIVNSDSLALNKYIKDFNKTNTTQNCSKDKLSIVKRYLNIYKRIRCEKDKSEKLIKAVSENFNETYIIIEVL